jgi:hypothetical protein
VGEALQELGEILLTVEVVAAFRGVVDVSGGFLQFLKSGEKFGWFAYFFYPLGIRLW